MARKKGSTLTLRLSPDENGKLNDLKTFLGERVGTKAIMISVEKLPEMAKEISDLKASVRKSENELYILKQKISRIKMSIGEVIAFGKIAK